MGDETVLQPECYKRHAEIEMHIQEGKGWRTAIIALVLAIIVQISGFLMLWGQLTKMVEINTKRLDRLENSVYVINTDRIK